jgi:hypothetical protein
MKLSTPRAAVTFTGSQEEAGALLLHLHAEGFCGVADGLVRPRITVPGISQEDLNTRVRAWERRCFEAKLAREKREGVR